MALRGNRLRKHKTSREEREALLESHQDEDSMYEHFTLEATAGQKPLRVDKFLANLLPFTSRSRIKNASLTGSVAVNGKTVKASWKIKPGDEIKLLLPYPPGPELEAENIPLDIRYEDEELLILHKPPGMVCHPSLGHRTGTLIHGLLWHFNNLPQPTGPSEHPRPGLVHRIDRDTSGILAIAKTEYSMAHVSKQFFDHTTDRNYVALVWGDVKENTGTVVAHIGRNQRDRKIFQAYPEGEVGKHAITHYEVLERYGVATLVRCKLETGRTHQIRVHMKHIGHTLFGDKEYGGDKVLTGPPSRKYQQFIRNCFEVMPRQALHARSLELSHPTTGERMAFESDLPADFQAAVDRFRSWAKEGE